LGGVIEALYHVALIDICAAFHVVNFNTRRCNSR